MAVVMHDNEKHKHIAILEMFLFVCSVQHSHMPLTFTKAILTAFCLRMCENKRFTGFPTQRCKRLTTNTECVPL